MMVASEANGHTPVAHENVDPAAAGTPPDAEMAALLQVLQVTVRTHDAYRHETDQASALAAWSESVALARAAIKAACASKREAETQNNTDTPVA